MGPKLTGICVLLILTLGLWSVVSQGAVFRDALGREVVLDKEPKRIVTLAPSLTETVYFLGLGARVVGVTEYSSYPPAARRKPKVGSYVDLNAEQIISLSPDLVIGTIDGNQPAIIELIEKAGIPVFLVNPRNTHQVIETILDIGRLCGVADKAEALTGELSTRVEEIVAKTAGLDRPLVFLQVNANPIMSVNAGTFSSDLIRLAGGRNMADREPITYPRISLEEVLKQGPQVIIVSSMERGGEFERVKRRWLSLRTIPAAKSGRVYLVDSDLIDRPSPRIVEGLELLARRIHPEADWDP
jgi:iron complex transport system substrate-binding protein